MGVAHFLVERLLRHEQGMRVAGGVVPNDCQVGEVKILGRLDGFRFMKTVHLLFGFRRSVHVGYERSSERLLIYAARL